MHNAVMVSERVYLRPLEVGDVETLARFEAAETETFYTRGRHLSGPIGMTRAIEETGKQSPPDRIVFGVCLIDGDRLIGEVELEDVDYINRVAETGSWIGPVEHRGKGYGTEAKHLLLECAFDRPHLRVLRSWVRESNTRSAAALRKQGYQPAGRLKWVGVKDGVYTDGLWFDVTREEWLAARGRTPRQAGLVLQCHFVNSVFAAKPRP